MRVNSGHPRRRKSDLVDAGWRICLSVSLISVWAFMVAVMATSPRGVGWVIGAVLLGLPILVALVFAFLTLNDVLVDRSWLRAERMTRTSDLSPGAGTTSE